MKVKCIKNKWNNKNVSLTIGKTYEVNYIYPDGDYRIIIDNGIEDWFPEYFFKTLSEIRNETINKLLE